MSRYDELRAALVAELEEPGAITKAEIAAVLARFPVNPATPPPVAAHDGPSGLVRLPGLTVPAGTVYALDPAADTTVEVTGNVVVTGTLRMRPNPGVTHVLRFVDLDETRFVGGGMDVLDSDVGLWVDGHGVLDLEGAPKTAWTRATGPLLAGQTVLDVEDATGWQVGDDLAVTPTGLPGRKAHQGYDERTVLAVDGNRVTVAPLDHDHPTCALPDGRVMAAEVLNLSRSVRVEGTVTGRAHIMVLGHSHDGAPAVSGTQHLSHVELRHLAPGALGRYALHFHHCGDGAADSTLTGIVARDLGSHAYVAHLSNGLTFTDCISHNTAGEPYWWDPREQIGAVSPPSHRTTYLRCVASKVTSTGHRLAGFALLEGSGNSVRDSVAVGVRGGKNAAGFTWTESADTPWAFSGNVSHNNKAHGIFTWQNTKRVHVVEASVCYRNDVAGLSHGAYRNRYSYQGLMLVENGEMGLDLHAVALDGPGLEFAGLTVTGSPWAVKTWRHNLPPNGPTIIRDSHLEGTVGAVWVAYGGHNGDTELDLIDLADCTFGPGEVVRIDGAGVLPGSLVRRIDDGIVTRDWTVP